MGEKTAAIIGFGGMGQRHYRAYQMNNVEVTAICDLDTAKVREVLPDFPRDGIYAGYRELIQDVDAEIVSVVTNGPTHAEVAMAASRVGVRNIFCEKPIATNLRDAQRVIDTCDTNGTRLAVNHIRRWSSNYLRIRDLIRSGAIGKVRHVYFSCGSTGLGNFAIHFFDIARFLTGDEAAWIVGFLDRTGTPNPRGAQFVDPGGYGVVSFRNGTRFFIDTSEDTGVQYLLQLVGTYGRIIIDELNDEWRIRSRDGSAISVPLTRYGTEMREIPFTSDARFDIVGLTAKAQAELLSGGPISATGEDGYRSLEMVVGFHSSDADGNGRVDLPLTGENLVRDIRIG